LAAGAEVVGGCNQEKSKKSQAPPRTLCVIMKNAHKSSGMPRLVKRANIDLLSVSDECDLDSAPAHSIDGATRFERLRK
jgi:hypothetical protein